MAQRDDAKTPTSNPRPLTEADVLNYLETHADFLTRHPTIIASQSPPSRFTSGDSLVDLQVFMIERLREDLAQLHGCAEDLITTTRSNMSTQSRTLEAVVALIQARGLAEVVRITTHELPTLLDVDVLAIALEVAPSDNHTPPHPELALADIVALPEGAVALLLGGDDKELYLSEEAGGEEDVFGSAASLVASMALVRMEIEGLTRPALLGLGSRDSSTFHPGQGTELLSFLARVLEEVISRWLIPAD